MKYLFALTFVVFSAFSAGAQSVASVTPAVSTETNDIRQKTFDVVWNSVNEKHYDTTFGGVDWKKVREVYKPKAAAAVSDKDFYDVLRQMLAELKLSHFGIYPPAAEMTANQTGRGVTGIDLVMIDDVPVISRVVPDSPAARVGVKTGLAVTHIDGKPWRELTAALDAAMNARKITPGMRKVYVERTLQAAINAKPATTLVLNVVGEGDVPQKFEMVRTPFTGEMSQALGNFPPQEVVFESRLLPNDIGYIRFNMWVIPQMAKLRKAMGELAAAKAIVIDLRGNPGGVGGMAPGLAGMLFKEKASLGSMKMRNGSVEFVAFPQPDPFAGPVVVLTDHGTGSTSEVFAAGMQETGRATVVGETTAGAVLPSVFEKLPTGYLFQYAISDYRSPKNILIEGRGVTPDVHVQQTRAALLAGNDAQLDEALKLLQKSSAKAK